MAVRETLWNLVENIENSWIEEYDIGKLLRAVPLKSIIQ